MPSEGELAPFTTSSDNNDDSRGLNCTVWQPKYAGGPVTTWTVALSEQINRLSAYQNPCVCRQGDGILVGSQIHRINVAYATEAKLWSIIWRWDHRQEQRARDTTALFWMACIWVKLAAYVVTWITWRVYSVRLFLFFLLSCLPRSNLYCQFVLSDCSLCYDQLLQHI